MTQPATPDGPVFCGVDTSLTSSGVTLLGGLTATTTIGREGITTLPLAERTIAIAELAAQILDWATRPWPTIKRYYPALVLLEAPDVSNSYGGLVERVALLHEVTRAFIDFGVPVGHVPSAALKGYAIGKGGGTGAKLKVREAAIALWPELAIEKAKPKKAQFDLADSAILAAMAQDATGAGRRVPDGHAAEWLWRDSIQYPPGVRAAR